MTTPVRPGAREQVVERQPHGDGADGTDERLKERHEHGDHDRGREQQSDQHEDHSAEPAEPRGQVVAEDDQHRAADDEREADSR